MNATGAQFEKDEDGMPMKATRVWLPVNPKIVSISACYNSTIALDENGQLWAWGEYFALRFAHLHSDLHLLCHSKHHPRHLPHLS